MRKFTYLQCCMLIHLVTLLGCESKTQPSIPAPISANSNREGSADVDRIVDDVFENHHVNKEELRLSVSEIKQSLGNNKHWIDFSIEEIEPGQYKGKASSAQGELFVVEARQTADGVYWRWAKADGLVTSVKSLKSYIKW